MMIFFILQIKCLPVRIPFATTVRLGQRRGERHNQIVACPCQQDILVDVYLE